MTNRVCLRRIFTGQSATAQSSSRKRARHDGVKRALPLQWETDGVYKRGNRSKRAQQRPAEPCNVEANEALLAA